MAANRVIGRNQGIPWHIPAEQQFFKRTTWGHPLIMGRKTYESIGCPLPDRQNIIISKNREFKAPDCDTVTDLKAAFSLCRERDKAFVIGGQEIFSQALPFADKIILTTIAREVAGDIFFPDFSKNDFAVVEFHGFEEPEPYKIEVLQRIRGKKENFEVKFIL